MLLRVHNVIKKTNIAGPGRRFSLWVQGCGRRCEGCAAAGTWDAAGGYPADTDEIIQNVLKTDGIEGITFLGGEPFEQAEALSEIGKVLKEAGLSVVTFTGSTIEELRSLHDDAIDRLLSVTDILIDGAFEIENKAIDRPWIGSSNQRYLFLTERYSQDDVKDSGNKIEVRISKDGRAIVAGMGEFGGIRSIQ